MNRIRLFVILGVGAIVLFPIYFFIDIFDKVLVRKERIGSNWKRERRKE